MIVNETIITALITGVTTMIVTIFGKNFWDFWKNRDIIKGQLKCKEKIAALEEEIHELETKLLREESLRNQTTIAINMLINIFDSEYGKDSKYKAIISEVKKYITPIVPLKKSV